MEWRNSLERFKIGSALKIKNLAGRLNSQKNLNMHEKSNDQEVTCYELIDYSADNNIMLNLNLNWPIV